MWSKEQIRKTLYVKQLYILFETCYHLPSFDKLGACMPALPPTTANKSIYCQETHSVFHPLSPEPPTCQPLNDWCIRSPMRFQICEYITEMGLKAQSLEIMQVFVIFCHLFSLCRHLFWLFYMHIVCVNKEIKNHDEVNAPVALKQEHFARSQWHI